MPSVNERPVRICRTLLLRGNFVFGWFTDLPDYLFGGLAFCSFSRLALGLDLLRSFAFCLCGKRLHASRSLAASRFASLAASRSTLRAASRSAFSAASRCAAYGSLDLRFLSGFALCLPRRLALGFSRSVALHFLLGSFTLRSLEWLRASPSLLPRASPAAQLRAGLYLPRQQALLRSAAASRPVASRLARQLSASSFAALLFASLTAAALLAASRFAFFAAASSFVTSCLAASASERRCSAAPFDSAAAASCLGGEVGCFHCSSLQRRNADSNLPPLGRRCSPALLGLLDIQFGFRFRLRLRFFSMAGPRSKWIEYICPKTCMARTGPAMTRLQGSVSAARRFGKPAEDVEDVRLRSTVVLRDVAPGAC